LSSLSLSFFLSTNVFFIFYNHFIVITPPKTLSYVVGLRTKDPRTKGPSGSADPVQGVSFI
jgi:hypothetical protein